jgi:hypothetical protein
MVCPCCAPSCTCITSGRQLFPSSISVTFSIGAYNFGRNIDEAGCLSIEAGDFLNEKLAGTHILSLVSADDVSASYENGVLPPDGFTITAVLRCSPDAADVNGQLTYGYCVNNELLRSPSVAVRNFRMVTPAPGSPQTWFSISSVCSSPQSFSDTRPFGQSVLYRGGDCSGGSASDPVCGYEGSISVEVLP